MNKLTKAQQELIDRILEKYKCPKCDGTFINVSFECVLKSKVAVDCFDVLNDMWIDGLACKYQKIKLIKFVCADCGRVIGVSTVTYELGRVVIDNLRRHLVKYH